MNINPHSKNVLSGPLKQGNIMSLIASGTRFPRLAGIVSRWANNADVVDETRRFGTPVGARAATPERGFKTVRKLARGADPGLRLWQLKWQIKLRESFIRPSPYLASLGVADIGLPLKENKFSIYSYEFPKMFRLGLSLGVL